MINIRTKTKRTKLTKETNPGGRGVVHTKSKPRHTMLLSYRLVAVFLLVGLIGPFARCGNTGGESPTTPTPAPTPGPGAGGVANVSELRIERMGDTFVLTWVAPAENYAKARVAFMMGEAPADCTVAPMDVTAPTVRHVRSFTPPTAAGTYTYHFRVCSVDENDMVSAGVTTNIQIAVDSTDPINVTNLTVGRMGSTNTFVVTWTAPADNYAKARVAFMMGEAPADCTVAPMDVTAPTVRHVRSFTPPTAAGTYTYHFRVCSVDENDMVSAGVTTNIQIAVDSTDPINVTNLTVGRMGSTNTFVVTWTAPAENYAKARVAFMMGGAPADCTVDSMDVDDPTVRHERTFTPPTATGRYTYGFRVCSLNSADMVSSGITETIEVVVDVPPENVTGLAVARMGSTNTFVVTWTKPADNYAKARVAFMMGEAPADCSGCHGGCNRTHRSACEVVYPAHRSRNLHLRHFRVCSVNSADTGLCSVSPR